MRDNLQNNFTLKGFTSILIGGYIFIGGYFIENIFKGFLIDDNPLGMLSAEIIEILVLVIIFLVFLFSSLALFFSGKRNAKKQNNQLWNSLTKKATKTYFLLSFLIFAILIFLMNFGEIDIITPIFLTLYAILLFVLKNKKRKNILVLSGLSVLLAIMCFLIPTYWASSLSILGIAHAAYGVAIKE